MQAASHTPAPMLLRPCAACCCCCIAAELGALWQGLLQRACDGIVVHVSTVQDSAAMCLHGAVVCPATVCATTHAGDHTLHTWPKAAYIG